MGYLNINSQGSKIIDVREYVKYLDLDCFVISGTKIDESFLSQEFAMDNFEIMAGKGRDCHGSYLLKFARKSFISKRQTHLEPNNLECICSESIISKIKWICFSICRPPSSQNLFHFLMRCLTRWVKLMNHTKALLLYFNTDIGISNSDHGKLE